MYSSHSTKLKTLKTSTIERFVGVFFVPKMQNFSLSYMDLTKYHKSTEFPMFRPSGSGSGGVEKFLSILHPLTQSQNASKINAYRDMLTE